VSDYEQRRSRSDHVRVSETRRIWHGSFEERFLARAQVFDASVDPTEAANNIADLPGPHATP
jgi:hypothetical protein